MNVAGIIGEANGLSTESAILVIAVVALAVVWKALDVVAQALRGKSERR
jgi:hypothetical protein